MAIHAVNSQPVGSQPSSGSFGTEAARGALDQDAFMKLLITQLQHQDPLNPMDNQEFVSQLAQFTSIERLGLIKKNLDDLLTAQLSNNAGQAVGFLGKEIRAQSDVLGIENGKAHEMYYRVNQPVSQVEIRLKNSSGRVVATFHNQPSTTGLHRVDMNRLLKETHQTLPDGRYQMVVSALDAAGKPAPIDVMRGGRVTGVTFQSGAPMLLINGTEVPLYAIVEMREPTATALPEASPLAEDSASGSNP